MWFQELRRRRRQPKPPLFLLPLDLPFEEVVADLVFPADWAIAGDSGPAQLALPSSRDSAMSAAISASR